MGKICDNCPVTIVQEQNTYARLIFDAERRLGSYLASDGNEKTDKYAQTQINMINKWTEALHASLTKQKE